MAATGLALTALHDGIDRVPDSLWHKVDFFCPPEEKEKKRRNSKRSGDPPKRRSSRRQSGDAKKQYSDSDNTATAAAAARYRRKTTQAATAPSSDRSRSTDDSDHPRPADSSLDKSATIAAPSGTTAAGAGIGPGATGAAAAATAAAGATAAAAAPAASATAPSAPPHSSTISSNPVTFTNPFAEKASYPPINGYSDGPAPEKFDSYQLPYRGPRHSVAIPSAPMSNAGQSYYPPPSQGGDEYGRGPGYDPSRYQPSGDYRYNNNSEGAVGNYYGDDRYGARAASADPYTRRGRSRYDDDSDEDYDRERSHRHRSKSRSSHPDKEARERQHVREKLTKNFDTSEGALGASVLGAALGGFIGHKFGKGPIATVAGAAVGGLGVNAWEAHRHRDKERRGERALVHSGRRAPSADAVDSRTRRDLEYYGSRADEERGSSRRGGSRPRGGSRGGYDDEYSDQGYDSGEDRQSRRKRSSSRRRRDDDY